MSGKRLIRPELEGGATVNGTEVIDANGNLVANVQDSLASGQIYVGNASGVASEVTPSGDVTISNTGVMTISASVIQSATVTLTNAQIKALNATPIELVAAGGAGTVHVLMGPIVFKLNAGSEALTEPNSDENIQILYGSGGTGAHTAVDFTNFLDQTSDETEFVLPSAIADAASSGYENKALVIENIGTGEIAGNASADATISISFSYRTITV